jgi:hypothetical protein
MTSLEDESEEALARRFPSIQRKALLCGVLGARIGHAASHCSIWP